MRFPFLLPSMSWLLLLTACASSPPESRVDAPLVEDKYRLAADRQALEGLRSSIPPEERQQNDELAFSLQWMGETKLNPSQVREKFNAAVSKKRAQFQKDMEKARTEFVRVERRDKDAFQKEQEAQRKEFRGRKATADERKSFFDDLEQKRRDFYASQREKRDAFESDIRDRRRNFDDYIREKTSEFNQEHRAYAKRYDDMKKEKDKRQEEERKKGAGKSVAPEGVDDEYKVLDERKGRPLGTDE